MPENQTIAIPNYLPSRTNQATFEQGLNAMASPHTLAPGEVQTTTNVDFSLEWGGAPCRRGSTVYAWEASHGVSTINITLVGRNYGLSTSGVWQDNLIPWYACADSGVSYSATGTAPLPLTLASVAGYSGGSQGVVFPQITQYGSYVYVANGTSAFKTNGAATYDWLLPQADTPTVTFIQQGTFTSTGAQAGAFVGFSGTMTATEGTITSTSTSSYFGNTGGVIVSTCTTGTGTRIVLIGTCTTNNWENPVVFVTLPTGTAVTLGAGTYTLGGAIDFHQGYPNGDTTGTYTSTATVTNTMTIGQYGTDYILLGLPDQQSVVTIQRDLSVGDTTFTNYWHSETTPTNITDANTDPLSLLLAAQGTAIFANQTTALNVSRAIAPNVGRKITPTLPVQRKTVGKTATAVSISPWGVARSDYSFVGTIPNPTFTNIQAIRIIIEFNATGKQALVGGAVTYGAQGWLLNDQTIGIQYWQTFARVENGFIVSEGAPSAPSAPQRAQYAYAAIVCASNSNTTAGITHRVFYRNGGLLQDAYRVGSCTITSGTATIYDYALPDLLIVNNPSLRRNLWSTWPSTSAGTGLPGVNAVSTPWQNRVWVGVQNQLYWSVPGNPSQIQEDSQTTVGDAGDDIAAIIPYTNLVLVNQASVYELSGTIFEGTNANWNLQRTGARRGSGAPKTCIKTPWGILLFSYDGISIYQSGYGMDAELDWVHAKIGDLWRGTGAADPAQIKNRIPALNQSAIYNSCAAYKDSSIYLAVPTGTNTMPDTVFVLQMAQRKVWMAQYPFKISSLYWDRVGNRLMAGTTNGTIQQIETGLSDTSPTNVGTGIVWSFKTRAWSTPTDVITENLQIEGVGTFTAQGVLDNTNTYTLTSATQANKGWVPASMQGTIADNAYFAFSGTQSGTQQEIYQLQWDFIPQTPKVTFFETDYVAVPSENYCKTWLAQLDFLGTATITGTLIADGTALLTSTWSSDSSGVAGRRWQETGLPNVTSLKRVRALYSSTTQFKYYDTQFEFEPKPFSKTTWIVTYKKAGGATQADMARFFAMDVEGPPVGTYTTTWIIDGTAFTTNTIVLGATDAGEGTEQGSSIVRSYKDQIPFPPGARGYLFQQQITATSPFKVWRASLDIDRIGIKGLSRVTMNGTPKEQEGRQP